MAITPLRASSLHTYPIRRILVSRSSFENPSPLDKLVRTSSPSSTSTRYPRRRNSSAAIPASVDLPAPDKPVNHSVKPSLIVPECHSLRELDNETLLSR